MRPAESAEAALDSVPAAPSPWQWLTLAGWSARSAESSPGLPRPDWMPTLPGMSVLAGTPGVHFSARSSAPQAEEPAASSTLDVEAGSPGEEADSEQLGGEDEGQATSHRDSAPSDSEAGRLSEGPGDSKPTLADYPARKRSHEDRRLPLTVEKSMLEIKHTLWGAASHGGMEQKEWKKHFASKALRHHEDRLQRAKQRCCPTEAMNALVQRMFLRACTLLLRMTQACPNTWDSPRLSHCGRQLSSLPPLPHFSYTTHTGLARSAHTDNLHNLSDRPRRLHVTFHLAHSDDSLFLPRRRRALRSSNLVEEAVRPGHASRTRKNFQSSSAAFRTYTHRTFDPTHEAQKHSAVGSCANEFTMPRAQRAPPPQGC